MDNSFELTSISGTSTDNAEALRAGKKGDAIIVGFSPDTLTVVLRIEQQGIIKQIDLDPARAERLAQAIQSNAQKIRDYVAGETVPGVPGDTGLGPCCACGEEGPTVRNLLALSLKAPVPHTGWGCILCKLPNDGAIAVLCDACIEAKREPVYACDGYPANKKRIRISELLGEHNHDPANHPGEDV